MPLHPQVARAAILLAGAVAVALSAAPAESQVIKRPVCESRDCPPGVFQAQLDSMLRFEGALTNDRDEHVLRVMRSMVRDTLERRPDDARYWLALSEIEAGLGDLNPAARAAQRARQLGADSALSLRAEAEARLRRSGQERQGAELYLEALNHLDRASQDRFLADLYPLLTQVEMEYWNSVDEERRGDWLRRYWEHRAAMAGVDLAVRLSEHYRRAARAAALFDPPGTGSGGVNTDDIFWRVADRRLPFDDRGIVFVRRGPPLDEMRGSPDLFSGLPNMVWSYRRADGSADIFYFAKPWQTGSAYRMVAPPACGAERASAASFAPGPATGEAGWVAEHAGRQGELNQAVTSCFGGDAFTRRANRSLNRIAQRRAVLDALGVESPRRPFQRPVDAIFDFYTFRGEDGRTEVVTALAIPLGTRSAQEFELRTTFADENSGVVGRRSASSHDTTTVVPATVDGEGAVWGFAHTATQVEPTEGTAFRVVLEDTRDADRGGLWGGTVRVPSYRGSTLLMSDVVVAATGPAGWTRGGTSMPLHPGRSYASGEAMVLFYELYELEPGQGYRTELTIEPERRGMVQRLAGLFGGGNRISLSFDGRAPDDLRGALQQQRTLRTELEPGEYRLRVEVRSDDGESATRERRLVITADSAGPVIGGR